MIADARAALTNVSDTLTSAKHGTRLCLRGHLAHLLHVAKVVAKLLWARADGKPHCSYRPLLRFAFAAPLTKS